MHLCEFASLRVCGFAGLRNGGLHARADLLFVPWADGTPKPSKCTSLLGVPGQARRVGADCMLLNPVHQKSGKGGLA